MTNTWEDHYKVLQVHFMAEPEIIKSAYLRLSKKYHPDVNASDSAEEKMKAINKAYEILSDPVSRKQYLARWMKNYSGFSAVKHAATAIHPLDFTVEPGRQVLLTYLNHLSKGRYDAAFEMLSEYDKRHILQADFRKWQSLVAAVFELIHYECAVQEVYAEVRLKGNVFEMAATLQVTVHENNRVMGRLEEDEFTKSVVLENKQWRVFLGYTELGTIIRRFEGLANLKKARPVHRFTLKKYAPLDSIAGAIKRREFHEKAMGEQMRFNRYGNPFSVIFCTFDLSQYPEDERAASVKEAGAVIASKIRNLDTSCHWRENVFAVLLPETNQAGARKTATKIRQAIEDSLEGFSMVFVIFEQRYASLQELFNRLQP